MPSKVARGRLAFTGTAGNEENDDMPVGEAEQLRGVSQRGVIQDETVERGVPEDDTGEHGVSEPK
jgi:hypothetical protein